MIRLQKTNGQDITFQLLCQLLMSAREHVLILYRIKDKLSQVCRGSRNSPQGPPEKGLSACPHPTTPPGSEQLGTPEKPQSQGLGTSLGKERGQGQAQRWTRS